MASEATRDLLLAVALLVGLGIVWFLTGGPERTAERGVFLEQPGIGSGQGYRVPSVNLGERASTSDTTADRGAWRTVSDYFGGFAEERSPHAAYVALERGRADGGYADEYVIVRIARSAPQKIVVSDWRLASDVTHISVPLGAAAALPQAGSVNTEQIVAANPGSILYIATARSPIGVGFRTNLCTGYLGQFQNFAPRLKLECPRPEDEAERLLGFNYDQSCADYVQRINRCQAVFTSIPGDVGAQCYAFIQNELTYNSCVAAHQQTPGFYRDEWRLFLKRDQELWRDRNERIKLLDESGKLIGAISY